MRRSAVVTAVYAVAIVVWYGTAQLAFAVHSIVNEFDRAKSLAALAPRPQATIVFDRYEKPAFAFFVEQRIDVPLDRVSPRMIEALLAVEDRRFYSHHGLDPIRIAGAAWRDQGFMDQGFKDQ